jgi:hypothetical protein
MVRDINVPLLPHPLSIVHLRKLTISSSTAALSHTLKAITLTKIKGLEKQRKSYARAKDAVLEAPC